MQTYILRRIMQSIPVLVLVSMVVFACLHVLPGDPFLAREGTTSGLTGEDLARLRAEVGLDRPVYVQYLSWVGNAVQGDFGVSYFSQTEVSWLVSVRLPATLQLTLFAMTFSMLISIPLGILAAVKQNSIVDYIVTAIGTIGMSLPSFWLGIMMIVVFSVHLGWLPAVGYRPFFEDPVQNLKHVILPCVTLGLILIAPTMRFLRSSVLEVKRQDYVQTARAKGLRERTVIGGHVLKNAMIPTLTIIGLQMGYLLGGSVVIEWVFGWPGLGQLAVDAIRQRDYAVVQASVMIFATGFILINLIVDILYGALDPRIRHA
jgi:peptide/nickel transport system permease protein